MKKDEKVHLTRISNIKFVQTIYFNKFNSN